MDGYQISSIFDKFPETKYLFQGIYSYDTIPQIIRNTNGFLVINTISESDNNKIGHWLLIFINEKNTIYFFDSFGNEPQFYGQNISKCFDSYPFRKVIVFSKPIQNEFSMVCGAYVIMFGYLMSKHRKASYIKSKFGRNSCKNDEIAVNFLYKNIGSGADLCPRVVFNRKCNRNCHCCK